MYNGLYKKCYNSTNISNQDSVQGLDLQEVNQVRSEIEDFFQDLHLLSSVTMVSGTHQNESGLLFSSFPNKVHGLVQKEECSDHLHYPRSPMSCFLMEL